MEKKRGDIVTTRVVQTFAFTDRKLAGRNYTQICDTLGQRPHGPNEEMDATFSGPETDPGTGDIEYNVTLLVRRKYTKKNLEDLDR